MGKILRYDYVKNYQFLSLSSVFPDTSDRWENHLYDLLLVRLPRQGLSSLCLIGLFLPWVSVQCLQHVLPRCSHQAHHLTTPSLRLPYDEAYHLSLVRALSEIKRNKFWKLKLVNRLHLSWLLAETWISQGLPQLTNCSFLISTSLGIHHHISHLLPKCNNNQVYID